MIPEGMRDVLPAEAAELHAIEEALRRRFAAYGYGEVRTPALEYAETLEGADDDTLGGRLPPLRRAGPRAHAAHRHDRAGGAAGGDALSRQAAAAAPLLRRPVDPPAGRRSAARTASSCRPAPS